MVSNEAKHHIVKGVRRHEKTTSVNANPGSVTFPQFAVWAGIARKRNGIGELSNLPFAHDRTNRLSDVGTGGNHLVSRRRHVSRMQNQERFLTGDELRQLYLPMAFKVSADILALHG